MPSHYLDQPIIDNFGGTNGRHANMTKFHYMGSWRIILFSPWGWSIHSVHGQKLLSHCLCDPIISLHVHLTFRWNNKWMVIFFHMEDIYLGFFYLETRWQGSLVSWQWRKMGPPVCHPSSAFPEQILALNTNKFMMMLTTKVQASHASILSVAECSHLKITGIGTKEMFLWGPMQTGSKLYLVCNEPLNKVWGATCKVIFTFARLKPICCYKLHDRFFGHHLCPHHHHPSLVRMGFNQVVRKKHEYHHGYEDNLPFCDLSSTACHEWGKYWHQHWTHSWLYWESSTLVVTLLWTKSQ